MSKVKAFFNKHSLIVIVALALIGAYIGFTATKAIANKNHGTKISNCQDICVALTPQGMVPNELAVKVGEYVQFNAADGERHNIAEGDGLGTHDGHVEHKHVGEFYSGEFGADEAWRVQFKKPGTYLLHDHYHPYQKILIVVY
jgi:plastocyanin